MKNKFSPVFVAGLVLSFICFGLNTVYLFSDMPHKWIPIPVHIVALVLVIAGIIKNKKY